VVLVSVCYVLGTLLLVPGFPMTLAVSILYGWWALAVCLLGGMIAALIAFLTSRYVARQAVKRLIDRYPAARAIDSITRDEPLKTVLLTRLNPVTPFAIENYAFGLTGVRLWPFILATAIGILPGTVLNVWIGVFGWSAAVGQAGIMGWVMLAIGIAAAIALTIWLTHDAKQKMQEEAGR
jgi:uncharacterized membrane protein YdjX (TVP38/TMEM64 family)